MDNTSSKNDKTLNKKDYELEPYVPEYEFEDKVLYKNLAKWFETTNTITAEEFNNLTKSIAHQKKTDYTKIYRCPKCGELSLKVFNYDNAWVPIRVVGCNSCDFIKPGAAAVTDYSAWEDFHKWLQKEHYITLKEKFRWY